MPRPLTKRDVDILEERGYWKASSFLHRIVKRLIRKELPVELRFIKEAHRIIFTTARQDSIAGKYRRHNGPELKRIDGTLLKMIHWHNIPNAMAELDNDVRNHTKDMQAPRTEKDYTSIIDLAVKTSHRLACIHPFENGNGRASRLLMDVIFLRAKLPQIAIKKTKPRYLRAMRQADDGDFTLLTEILLSGLVEAKEKSLSLLQRRRHRVNKK